MILLDVRNPNSLSCKSHLLYWSVVQNYTLVTPQRQAQLKEQHHPGFHSRRSFQSLDAGNSTSTAKQIELPRIQMKEAQQRYHQELQEAKQTFQEERQLYLQEKLNYGNHNNN